MWVGGFGQDSLCMCVSRAAVNNVSSDTIRKEEKVFGILKWLFYSFHHVQIEPG